MLDGTVRKLCRHANVKVNERSWNTRVPSRWRPASFSIHIRFFRTSLLDLRLLDSRLIASNVGLAFLSAYAYI